eukprot:2963361-Rhodomonas_salina.2
MAVSPPQAMLASASGPLYCHCLFGRNVLWLCTNVATHVPDCIAVLILFVASGTVVGSDEQWQTTARLL